LGGFCLPWKNIDLGAFVAKKKAKTKTKLKRKAVKPDAPFNYSKLTREELGGLCGVSKWAPDKWRKDGCPQNLDKSYCAVDVLKWLEDNQKRSDSETAERLRLSLGMVSESSSEDPQEQSAKNKLTSAQANLAELKLKKEQDKIIDIETVESERESRVSEIKAGLKRIENIIPDEVVKIVMEWVPRNARESVKYQVRALLTDNHDEMCSLFSRGYSFVKEAEAGGVPS
jgi:phage terminase Nu1 subunit (DNA packaging protein)